MNSNNEVKNFDVVLKEAKKTEITKEYIVKNIFDLTIIKNDIHYIKTIKVQPYSNTNEIHKLTQNNFINISIGGQNFYERDNDDVRYCTDNDDFVVYDFDFPSPIFFIYHSQILSLSNLNKFYRIVIDGYCFDNITKLIKGNIVYEYYHNDKYNFKDETDTIVCRSMSGMVGISSNKYQKWYKNDFNLYNDSKSSIGNNCKDKIEVKTTDKSSVEYSEFHEFEINLCDKNNDESNLSIIHNCKDKIETRIVFSNTNKNILYFLNQTFKNDEIFSILHSTKFRTQLTEGYCNKNVEDYYDYLLGLFFSIKLEVKYIETKDNLYSLTYIVPKKSDLIYKIRIKNKLNKLDNIDDKITIKLNSYYKETCVTKLNDDIEFDTLVNFDPYNDALLTITLDKYYMEYICDLFLDIGYCVCNTNLRKDVICLGTQLKIEQ